MDTMGFVFGITGMTFGLLGFLLGVNASHTAKSAVERIEQLEQRFSDRGDG